MARVVLVGLLVIGARRSCGLRLRVYAMMSMEESQLETHLGYRQPDSGRETSVDISSVELKLLYVVTSA